MNSKQQDCYTEFEPDANEIMFGQRTAPNRTLTEKELSRRKRIILKLVDQKLKFELIELMKRQLKNTSNVHASSSDSSVASYSNTESWTMTSNYYSSQNFNQHGHFGSGYLQQNWQPRFENAWQPSVPQQHGSAWSHVRHHHSQSSFQFFEPHQNRIMRPSFRPFGNHSNLNSGHTSTLSSKSTKPAKYGSTSTSFSKNLTQQLDKISEIPMKKSLGKVSTSAVTSTSLCSKKAFTRNCSSATTSKEDSTRSITQSNQPISKQYETNFDAMRIKNTETGRPDDKVIEAEKVIDLTSDEVYDFTSDEVINSKSDEVFDFTSDEVFDTEEKCPQNDGTEWNPMNKVVTNVFRSESKNSAPSTKTNQTTSSTAEPSIKAAELSPSKTRKRKLEHCSDDGFQNKFPLINEEAPFLEAEKDSIMNESGTNDEAMDQITDSESDIETASPGDKVIIAEKVADLTTNEIPLIDAETPLLEAAKDSMMKESGTNHETMDHITNSEYVIETASPGDQVIIADKVADLTTNETPFINAETTFLEAEKDSIMNESGTVDEAMNNITHSESVIKTASPGDEVIIADKVADLTSSGIPLINAETPLLEAAKDSIMNESGINDEAMNHIIDSESVIETASPGDEVIIAEEVYDLSTDELYNLSSDEEFNFDTKEKFSQNEGMEWNLLNQLVTGLFRNVSKNNWEPLSSSELKLKNKILVRVSINPNTIRSYTQALQRSGIATDTEKIENFVDECQNILANLSRTDPDSQTYFSKLRNQLIDDLKESKCRHEKNSKNRSAYSEILSIISPFLTEENQQELIQELMKNPYALESNELIKSRISDKAKSASDIMKGIKGALDEFMPVRLPKKFHSPLNRCIDVPFVVDLYDKTAKMTKEYADELTRSLLDSIDGLKTFPKPAIRDIEFKDGSLTILCVNSMTFDWLEKTISNNLDVKVLPMKNIIPKNELKTVCLKFESPQYYHFNCLMEQLKEDNPRLLTRRWELRYPPHTESDDSTKCVHVGVDAESLICLEQMNRVGTFRGSTVSFEIQYDEENFENTNFVTNNK